MNPLVTLFVYAYNQDKYVRNAIRSAFSQTYSPTEIILSDDASTDSTFDIIEEEARRYRGPHRVRTNRNQTNIGVVAHVNASALELACGRLVIAAAGDDISVPTRVEEIVKVWLSNSTSAIGSNATVIDEQNHALGLFMSATTGPITWQDMARSGSARVFGATLAWERDIFDVFGPLPGTIRNEDQLIPFRAALLKGTYYIDKPLVRYRYHASNLSYWSKIRSSTRDKVLDLRKMQLGNMIANYELWCHSLAFMSPRVTENPDPYPGLIRKRINRLRNEEQMIGQSFAQRLHLLATALTRDIERGGLVRRLALAISPYLYSTMIKKLVSPRLKA